MQADLILNKWHIITSWIYHALMYTIIRDGSLNMCASYLDNIKILIRHKIAHLSIRQSGYFDVFF